MVKNLFDLDDEVDKDLSSKIVKNWLGKKVIIPNKKSYYIKREV